MSVGFSFLNILNFTSFSFLKSFLLFFQLLYSLIFLEAGAFLNFIFFLVFFIYKASP